MAGICFLLGFISVLYFLGIWRMTGLSSRFPLVWLFFSGSFFLAGSCILLEIEVPIWLGVFIGIYGVLYYKSHASKGSEKSGLYCGAGSAGTGKCT